MRDLLKFALALLTAMALAVPGHSGDKEWKPIQVTWHGQSFFEIKSSKGTNIVIDPHMIPVYGRLQGVKADIVLISHNHNDHTQIGVIENIRDKDIKVILGLKGGGARAAWNQVDEKIKDVHIRSVGNYHDAEEGMRYGKNTSFIMDLDGWRVVHLGDLGHMLSPEQLRKLGRVDVLMIPVGGIYTLNGNEAKKVVEQIKPREYIFPMHCGTKIYDEVLPADEFLEDQLRANVTVSLDNKITLNRDPQRPRPLIVQLNFWPRGKRE
jgi:L-ascorbate metabolism protein UlaG (beta-lactamase superfamily)